MRGRRRIDSSSIIAHPVNFETSLKCDAKNSTYICIYIYIRPLDNRYRFCISVQPEIDCTTFHIFLFEKKKCFLKFQKLTGLWLAGVVVNHVGIYGSKVAEGLSAFQRRSCLSYRISFISYYPYLWHGGHIDEASSILSKHITLSTAREPRTFYRQHRTVVMVIDTKFH